MQPSTPQVNGKSIKFLTRSELQQLFKAQGLKGANAKNSDLIEQLKMHMVNQEFSAVKPVEPQTLPSVDSESEDEPAQVQPAQVETPSESNEIKQFLEENKLNLAELFEKEELDTWETVQALDFEHLRVMGVKTGSALKLLNAIKAKFSLDNDKFTCSMKELKEIVEEMVKEFKPKPTAPTSTSIAKPKPLAPSKPFQKPIQKPSFNYGMVKPRIDTGLKKEESGIPRSMTAHSVYSMKENC